MIIGHRGAAGIEQENSLDAMQAGLDDGADMIECDVQLTSDNVPVVIHDSDLSRTHGYKFVVRLHTFAELRALKLNPEVPSLDELIEKFIGKTLINIEVKSRATARPVLETLRKYCGDSRDKWDSILVSSYLVKELVKYRDQTDRVNLALLHHNNPFLYIAYHRRVDFTAVGFHRLHLNKLATEIAKKAGIFTYAYTANRPESARPLEVHGVEGIVTDYPSKIASALID